MCTLCVKCYALQIGECDSDENRWNPSATSPTPPGGGACGNAPLPAARDGGKSSAESNRDNDSNVSRVPHPASARRRSNARGSREATAAGGAEDEATREAVNLGADGRACRGTAAVAAREPQSLSSSKRSFGARVLLGASQVSSANEAGACSTAGGRGRQPSSHDGEAGAREQAAAVATATTAFTRGRVGMRKARRTYGR